MMKGFMKILRFILLAFLIVLATVGIGLAGGVPLALLGKRKTREEHHVEWVVKEENKENEEEGVFRM